MPSPSQAAPLTSTFLLLPVVRVALVTAWCTNVVLIAAAWLNAFDGGPTAKLLGPSALLGWMLLIGWLGWRWQFRHRVR